jgi:hypothetical protein
MPYAGVPLSESFETFSTPSGELAASRLPAVPKGGPNQPGIAVCRKTEGLLFPPFSARLRFTGEAFSVRVISFESEG